LLFSTTSRVADAFPCGFFLGGGCGLGGAGFGGFCGFGNSILTERLTRFIFDFSAVKPSSVQIAAQPNPTATLK